MASVELGDESEECDKETDWTRHSHPHVDILSSYSERLCRVSLKCDVSYLQDTLSGVYDMGL